MHGREVSHKKAAKKKQREREPKAKEARIISDINYRFRHDEKWVQDLPKTDKELVKLFQKRKAQETTLDKMPPFHSHVRDKIEAAAKQADVYLPPDTFAGNPSSLTADTYAPRKLGAKHGTQNNKTNWVDNSSKRHPLCWLLKDGGDGYKGGVLVDWGQDHGGEGDVYLPDGISLGVVDPDTGQFYRFSQVKPARRANRR